MITSYELAAGVVLPAIVTALILLLGWRLTRRQLTARDSRSWAGPPAVAVGFSAGYFVLLGWPGVPPVDAIDWLPFISVVLALVGLGDTYFRVPPPGRVLLISIAVPVSFLLLAWPRLVNSGADSVPAQLIIATGVCVTVLVLTDILASRSSAGRLSAIWLAVTLPSAVALGCSGSARLGMIAVVLAATQAGALLANVVLGRAGLGRGTVVVFGTLLGGLLLCGVLYAELRSVNGLILAASPVVAWLGRRGPHRFGWLAHVAAQVGMVLAVASIAAWQAWRELPDTGW